MFSEYIEKMTAASDIDFNAPELKEKSLLERLSDAKLTHASAMMFYTIKKAFVD